MSAIIYDDNILRIIAKASKTVMVDFLRQAGIQAAVLESVDQLKAKVMGLTPSSRRPRQIEEEETEGGNDEDKPGENSETQGGTVTNPPEGTNTINAGETQNGRTKSQPATLNRTSTSPRTQLRSIS